MNPDPDYAVLYSEFQQNYKTAQISGEECGICIMKLAGLFMQYNLKYAEALKQYTAVKATLANQVDPQTGKGISSSKADVLADATPEHNSYEMAKVHICNIEQAINALKALSRSLQTEYNNS